MVPMGLTEAREHIAQIRQAAEAFVACAAEWHNDPSCSFVRDYLDGLDDRIAAYVRACCGEGTVTDAAQEQSPRWLLVQSVDAAYVPYIALSYGRHAEYAQRCGAEYVVYTGLKDAGCHPAWNRIALLRDGLMQGYQKIVWLDADTLVLNPEVNIFTDTRHDVDFQLCRYANYLWYGRPCVNTGVMVVNASPSAVEALQWIWEQRDKPLRSHHVETFWEQNWVADYVHEHQESCADLSHAFNYHARYSPFTGPVVIQSWPGEANRLEQMRQAFFHPDLTRDAMPASDWQANDPWEAAGAPPGGPAGRQYYPMLTKFIREEHIRSVVEIGVRSGYSMAAMMRGNPELTYLGIDLDLPVRDFMAGAAEHAEALRQKYSRGESGFLLADSSQLSTLPQRFDLAYIDGNHTEEACFHDLELCAPSCDRILADDYGVIPAVRQAIQRFCRQYRLPLGKLGTASRWALLEMRLMGHAAEDQTFPDEPYCTNAGDEPAISGVPYLYTEAVPTYHPHLGLLMPGRVDIASDLVSMAEGCPYLRRVDAD
jgi:Methyltransferase domain